MSPSPRRSGPLGSQRASRLSGSSTDGGGAGMPSAIVSEADLSMGSVRSRRRDGRRSDGDDRGGDHKSSRDRDSAESSDRERLPTRAVAPGRPIRQRSSLDDDDDDDDAGDDVTATGRFIGEHARRHRSASRPRLTAVGARPRRTPRHCGLSSPVGSSITVVTPDLTVRQLAPAPTSEPARAWAGH